MRAYERLLNYVKYDTTSDENAPEDTCPSTPGQMVFARALADEMRAIGIDDAQVDPSGYVYGTVEAAGAQQGKPTIGFIAHMDTSPAASGKNIKPRIIKNYDGGDITLGSGDVMRTADYPRLARYSGDDLMVTDGTTLLGADDKAGIAEILTAAQELIDSGEPHGKIKIAFTPDEEIGRGADRFDVRRFGADYAYTVDGGAVGGIEFENFNAASAKVTVHGFNIHPGEAKGRMRNALLIGMRFDALLPEHEIPFCTEGYEGFHHLTSMSGCEETAKLEYIIRDHDKDKFAEKKAQFERAAAYIDSLYGKGTVQLEIKDSYRNMREKIEPCMFLIDNAARALKLAGAVPVTVPIRGGTDGARLSFMGLPCPNLPTGGENFHGRLEYISLQSMDTMAKALVMLARM